MVQRTIQILFALLRSAICGTKLTEEERNNDSPELLPRFVKIWIGYTKLDRKDRVMVR